MLDLFLKVLIKSFPYLGALVWLIAELEIAQLLCQCWPHIFLVSPWVEVGPARC